MSQKKLLNFSKRIKKITTKHKVKFIINDNFTLASKINADGCHMGQYDGSFFKSRLKPSAKKANLNILKWAKKNIKKPIIVIGGINNINYKKLINAGAKYIALSSFIWDNPKLKPEQAIRKFK